MVGIIAPYRPSDGARAMTDVFSAEKRSWIMSRVRGTDTKPEVTLRRELWRRGLRFRKSYARLPGRPDIAFTRARVAVFVDGEFWHGHKLSEERMQYMTPYWQQKIARNVARDGRVNAELKDLGWSVLRFGERDVLRRLNQVADEIEEQVRPGTQAFI